MTYIMREQKLTFGFRNPKGALHHGRLFKEIHIITT